MITITGLKKTYKHHQVLKSIDIEIHSGSVTAIVGPNGSGKTTLLKSILGLVIPESGSISVEDQQLKAVTNTENKLDICHKIMVSPQTLR
ncbi:MAG: amino acid ABC transporter ATP-binding protein [Ignavibacteriales bacterium]|nr:amino acid ABC transporter ATP-binding protein [Ignavibacteriales bacterium]